MPEFVHFGSIFATRFKSGKDLRITDSNGTMKTAWVAGSGKLIAANPQYLTLSPKFIAGEHLLEGKPVTLDGGRYICRLPYVAVTLPCCRNGARRPRRRSSSLLRCTGRSL